MRTSLRPFNRLIRCRLFSNNNQSSIPPESKTQPKFPMWKSMAFTALCGAGILFYFNYEKKRLIASRKFEPTGVVGTPRIGGPIQLIDQDGNEFDSTKLKNNFMLVYFGFTHCPDICPEELDKMTSIMNVMEVEKTDSKVIPVFITVDPDRDNPKQIKEYLKDFHPKFVGLTGDKESVKEIAKKYRVYFRPARTSGDAQDSKDYLVDHSIFYFLIDPDGNYVTHFGKDSSIEKSAKIITDALHSWDLSK